MSDFLITFIFVIFVCPFALGADCIGRQDAPNSFVYMHGMDTTSPGPQELANRQTLAQIAKKLDVRFAVPRATDACPKNVNQICWGWNFNDVKQVDAALAKATSSAAECFPNAKKMGMVGFSNGGFFVNQIVKDCRKTKFTSLISIGAASSWNDSKGKDLAGCGKIRLMAGKKDLSNYEAIKNLFGWFKKNGADAVLVEYDQGHEIPERELEQTLKSAIAE